MRLSGLAGVLAAMALAGCANTERTGRAGSSQPAARTAEVAAPVHAPTAQPAQSPLTANPFDYGTTQPVRPDVNAQAASVGQALKGHDHPERLSPLIAPGPFDLAAYRKNPQAYLDVVEPGRVFQVAQPGPEVPRIAAVGPAQTTIAQGATATLQVRVTPGMPVTYTSFDLGRFAENQLTSITVAADERGLASATFVAAGGTIGEVDIIAACPVTAGQVTYHVDVARN